MVETLLMVLVCLGFLVVSIALAFSFGMNAYLDYQEHKVLMEQGLSLVTQRNSKEQEEADDDSAY